MLDLQRSGAGTRWLARDVELAGNAHKWGLLLMELMHFVNNLHVYLMDRCVRIEWEAFEASLTRTAAQSLDDLRARHFGLLDAICDACLLHPRSRVALQQVRKVLNVCLQACTCCRAFLEVAPARVEWTGARTDSGNADNARLAQVLARMRTLRTSFRRTNRFLIVLIRSHVRSSAGAASVLESILTMMDFSGFYCK